MQRVASWKEQSDCTVILAGLACRALRAERGFLLPSLLSLSVSVTSRHTLTSPEALHDCSALQHEAAAAPPASSSVSSLARLSLPPSTPLPLIPLTLCSRGNLAKWVDLVRWQQARARADSQLISQLPAETATAPSAGPHRTAETSRITSRPSCVMSLVPPVCRLTLLPHELLGEILSNLWPVDDFALDETGMEAPDALNDIQAAQLTCCTLYNACREIFAKVPPIRRVFSQKGRGQTLAIKRCDAGPQFLRFLHANLGGAMRAVNLRRLQVFVEPYLDHDLAAEANLLQERILGLCGHGLRRVTVTLNNPLSARSLAVIIAGMPQLVDLGIVLHERAPDAGNLLDALQVLLTQLYIRAPGSPPLSPRIEQFSLSGFFDSAGKSTSPFSLGTNLPWKCLRLDSRRASDFSPLKALLADLYRKDKSASLANLTHLELLEAAPSTSSQAHELFDGFVDTLCDNDLVHFAFDPTDAVEPLILTDYFVCRFPDAGDHSPRIAHPLELFGMCPHCRKLHFVKGAIMNLGKLDLLAAKSPDLETLDLPETTWSDIATLYDATKPFSTPFEAELIKTLERFTKLRLLDVGIWPYLVPSSSPEPHPRVRPELVQWAEERGIELVVRGCKPRADD